MKLFHTKTFVLAIIILSLAACGGSGSETAPAPGDTTAPTTPGDTTTPKTVEVSGQFQKGPFIVGTEVTIQELDNDLNPTGRSFQTETTSNLGDYLLSISLTNALVEISANGYYFNEITGALSSSTIRLSALADTSDNPNININILTHLAKKRIRKILSTGRSFPESKQQAELEVRNIFSFDDNSEVLSDFGQMDISQSGKSNAFLLLVSSIFQKAYDSSADLSEFIESLSQDLSDNGVVNNNALKTIIRTNQISVDFQEVRANLESIYASLGLSVVIPDFATVINRAPIARITLNGSGGLGTPTTLSGSGSTDIDHDELEFAWSLTGSPEGSVAAISNSTSETAAFIPDIAGTYTFSLVLSDGEYSSNVAIAWMSTINRPPIAIAGENQSIHAGESFVLNGSDSSDPDNDELTYLWTNNVTSETSSNAIWSVSSIPIPLPIPLTSLNYSVHYTLTVTDKLGLESQAQVNIGLNRLYTDNGDGTVSNGFGHMWQKEDQGPFPSGGWPGSCGLTGGYDDWNVPTLQELLRLVDSNNGSPTIDTASFPNAKLAYYGTRSRAGSLCLSYVSFVSGKHATVCAYEEIPPEAEVYYLRCVR